MPALTISDKFYLETHRDEEPKSLAKALKQPIKIVREFLATLPQIEVAATSPSPQATMPPPSMVAGVFNQKTPGKKTPVSVSSAAASQYGDTFAEVNKNHPLRDNPNVFHFKKD